jgi:hypothetical protein
VGKIRGIIGIPRLAQKPTLQVGVDREKFFHNGVGHGLEAGPLVTNSSSSSFSIVSSTEGQLLVFVPMGSGKAWRMASLGAPFECRATLSPHRTKNLINSPLPAPGNADRKKPTLFALHNRALERGLCDLLRKHLSGRVGTIHFELPATHGRLHSCRLFAGEKLCLAHASR